MNYYVIRTSEWESKPPELSHKFPVTIQTSGIHEVYWPGGVCLVYFHQGDVIDYKLTREMKLTTKTETPPWWKFWQKPKIIYGTCYQAYNLLILNHTDIIYKYLECEYEVFDG